MKKLLILLCASAAVALAAAQPYLGKWKTNLAKSDFGLTAFTIESLPASEWQTTMFGITAKFKMDGNDYPDGMGGSVAWKEVGNNTWESVSKANGKVTARDTLKLSADGKTLTDSNKEMKLDGGSIDSTTVYSRVSGGPGLAGKWQTKKVSGGAGIIELTASGSEGLTFKDLDQGMTCASKLDGKDYPCTGPMLPPGFTSSVKTAGRSLDLTVKKDGLHSHLHSLRGRQDAHRDRRPRHRRRQVQDSVRPHVGTVQVASLLADGQQPSCDILKPYSVSGRRANYDTLPRLCVSHRCLLCSLLLHGSASAGPVLSVGVGTISGSNCNNPGGSSVSGPITSSGTCTGVVVVLAV